MNDFNEQKQSQLENLAEYLEEATDRILSDWRRRVSDDKELETAARLTRRQFVNHVPLILKTFRSKLSAAPETEQSEKEKEAAESHSRHRWQQGYDLRTLVGEWGHLNTCLVETLEEYRRANGDLHDEVMPTARRALADLMQESLTQSVAEFYNLLKSEAEIRVRELETGLERVRELDKERGELLRMATHDLRGNLSVVTGTASMMGTRKMSEEDDSRMRRLMKKSTAALASMLTDLMDMARLEAGQETRKLTEFDAGQLLADLCQSAEATARERNLYLEYEGEESLPVEGDPVKVRRVAQNLVLNALKYTTDGGVRVFWAEHSEKRWLLRVEDTGPGLYGGTAAPLVRKLEKATAAAHEVEGKAAGDAPLASESKTGGSSAPPKHVSAGEGIGLSIVKRLCELLDATLELETEAGVGTRFTIFFPRRYH